MKTNSNDYTRPRKIGNPKQPKRITYDYLYNAGLYYLKRFPAGTNRFEQVMKRKIIRSCQAHPSQDFDECIATLNQITKNFTNLGYLNDELYAQSLVNSLINRGFSITAIKSKAREKGLNDDIVQKTLSDQEPDELIQAIKFIKKKKCTAFHEHAKSKNEQIIKEKMKTMNKMARAGFSYDIYQHIMNMSEEEADELLYQCSFKE